MPGAGLGPRNYVWSSRCGAHRCIQDWIRQSSSLTAPGGCWVEAFTLQNDGGHSRGPSAPSLCVSWASVASAHQVCSEARIQGFFTLEGHLPRSGSESPAWAAQIRLVELIRVCPWDFIL